jgi:hypothetical protein
MKKNTAGMVWMYMGSSEMVTIDVVKRAADNGGREGPNSEANGKEGRATEDVCNSNPSVITVG